MLIYLAAITVTYIPYIFAELPSNLMFKKVGPRRLLPMQCLLWGLVSTLQSKVSSYSGLLACRFFLGLFEGGLFPGLVLYLTDFYRPHELQIRVGLFFSAAALSGAFSGLLAAAIEQMNGMRGIYGWQVCNPQLLGEVESNSLIDHSQWIFLLEGLFTICFALFSFWILPDTPLQVKTLSVPERENCLRRLERDAKGMENTNIIWSEILPTLKDTSLWILVLVLFCDGVSLYGLAYFTPSIVAGFGYSATKTQLYTVPPFAIAFVATVIGALVADGYKARGAVAMFSTVLSIIGFAMFYTSETIAVRYTSLFFMITGVYSTAPCLITSLSNNSAAHTRRATAVALGFISTNLGGIVSTWIYPSSSAPHYTFAARFNLALNCFMLVGLAGNILILRKRNNNKIEKRDDLLKGVENLPASEQYEILGDRHPDFKYTL
jgi:MFS family permease